MEQVKFVRIDREDFEDALTQIEQLFDMRFDFAKIYDRVTVGEIIDTVIEKSVYPEGAECAFQLVFFRLRKDLAHILSVPAKNIQPETPLENIFPVKGRRRVWKKMFCFNPVLRCPQLKPAKGIWIPLIAIFITCAGIIIGDFTVLTLTSFLIFFFIFLGMLKIRNQFPCHTVGELAQLLLKMNYPEIRKEFQTFNRREIENLICELVGEWSLQTVPAKITPDTQISYLGE